MKQHLTFCATLVAFGVGAIAPASAQYYYGAPRPPAYVGPRMYSPALPPQEITAIVRASGLVPLSQPVRRGPNAYVVVAAGRGGEQVRVIVDAYAGDIRRVNPMVAMRPYGAPPVAAYPYDPRARGALVEREVAPPPREIRPPQPGAYPPGARYQPDTIAPRATPNARVATAPSMNPQTSTAQPQHAPLPRPRPSVAAATPTPQAAVPPPAAAPAPAQQAAPSPAPAPVETAPKTEAPIMAPVTPLD